MPEALAVLRSTKLPKVLDHDTLTQFIDKYFETLRNDSLSVGWTLSEAAGMERSHHLIQQFTDDFAAHALTHHPDTGELLTRYESPSGQELQRIQRSFYRFELYCNLFSRRAKVHRRDPINSKDKEHKYLFARFAPWELEQLVCIYDFLYRQISERMVSVYFPFRQCYMCRQIF